MDDINNKKKRLDQKKARLQIEEAKLRITERKQRTRSLIELGGLIVKAGLDHLPVNTIYGALLSLKSNLNDDSHIKNQWTKLGRDYFDQEQKERVPVILTIISKPNEEIRTHLRNHRLKWNYMRKEWYGYATDIETLKLGLTNIKHTIELIKD